jgi:sulfite reductase (NADPH) hemoprotein beta-component
MACVALPTCGLAFAEAERYLPQLIDKIDEIADESGLRNEEITIRMTGCPNGCARHALAEIGFIGKAVGKYNMYLGAAFDGSRLSKMYRENIGEEEILNELRVLLPRYATERLEGEHFGDFVVRVGIIEATTDGTNFHN